MTLKLTRAKTVISLVRFNSFLAKKNWKRIVWLDLLLRNKTKFETKFETKRTGLMSLLLVTFTHQLRGPEVPRAEQHPLDEDFGVGDDCKDKAETLTTEGKGESEELSLV